MDRKQLNFKMKGIYIYANIAVSEEYTDEDGSYIQIIRS